MNPDFIVGSYSSAFGERRCTSTRCRGIFNITTGPCNGAGSDWFVGGSTSPAEPLEYSRCRPQLHAVGIGTWLEPTGCSDSGLKPAETTEETVYQAVRDIGKIFNVEMVAEKVVAEIKMDFDIAEQAVAKLPGGIKAAWLDCVGRCCNDEESNGNKLEDTVFVGAGGGAPNLIMKEAGLTNVFKTEEGSWKCVKMSKLLEAKPDVIVLAHASWDTWEEKVEYLHNRSSSCEASVVQRGAYIQIPFSASTLGPRNGVAALDLALAALHLKTGSVEIDMKSGVTFLGADVLSAKTANLMCPYVPAACDPGHQGPAGGPCIVCPADTYCPAGTTSAEACPASTSSEAGSSSITQCLFSTGASPYTHQVKFQVKLPYSKAGFDAAKQIFFRVSVAEASSSSSHSVEPSAVIINNIADARRRAGSVQVDVSIKTLSKTLAKSIASDLSADKLNAKLKAHGLEEADMVTEPSVSALDSSGSGRLSRGAVAGIVIGCLVGAGLMAALGFMIMREKQGSPVFMRLEPEEDHVTSKTETPSNAAQQPVSTVHYGPNVPLGLGQYAPPQYVPPPGEFSCMHK